MQSIHLRVIFTFVLEMKKVLLSRINIIYEAAATSGGRFCTCRKLEENKFTSPPDTGNSIQSREFSTKIIHFLNYRQMVACYFKYSSRRRW